MRRFLYALPLDDKRFEIGIDSLPLAVGGGGLVSPVFPAFGGNAEELAGAEALLACFPRSPSALLALIQNELPRALQPRTLVSYGLASVLLYGAVDNVQDALERAKPLLQAYEYWPLIDGVVNEDEILRFAVEPTETALPVIVPDNLPYDAACQVRQLDTSLALAIHRASVFAPELVGALSAIRQGAAGLVDAIREINSAEKTLDSVRRHHYYLSRLLEINAGLSLVISQTLGGASPLVHSEYPVAEYGLLGIGGASRSLWGFYNHLRSSFITANQANRIANIYRTTTPFDPYLDWSKLDYSTWSDAPAQIAKLPDVGGRFAAPHLLHFSSRFGFHETEYTLGASWQSIHASSSQEWHLLTVTHEFIHSQVRHITASIFPAETDWERISEIHNGAEPANALESMQVAFTQAMARYAAARDNSYRSALEAVRWEGEGYNSRPTADEAHATVDAELRHLQEIVVHVLDYLYTFAGDPGRYLAAIWQSWSTVPSVTERIHDYLLRSLCALAADAIMPDRDETPVFREVYAQAVEHLTAVSTSFESPVVVEALSYLTSEFGAKRLELEFSQAYYMSRLTRSFIYDEGVAADLRRDELTAIIEDSDRRYVYEPGQYPDSAIGSPMAFLSDRFGQESEEAEPGLEFESLWQLLLLVNPDSEW